MYNESRPNIIQWLNLPLDLQIIMNIHNSMTNLFQQSKTLRFIVYNCQGRDRIQLVWDLRWMQDTFWKTIHFNYEKVWIAFVKHYKFKQRTLKEMNNTCIFEYILMAEGWLLYLFIAIYDFTWFMSTIHSVWSRTKTKRLVYHTDNV